MSIPPQWNPMGAWLLYEEREKEILRLSRRKNKRPRRPMGAWLLFEEREKEILRLSRRTNKRPRRTIILAWARNTRTRFWRMIRRPSRKAAACVSHGCSPAVEGGVPAERHPQNA